MDTYADLFSAIQAQRSRMAFFVPVAFHAHSIDSYDWAQRPNAAAERNDRQRLDSGAGVTEFLDALARHYRVVCITDHMRSGYASRLAKAAQERDDITVLPGVEISCEAPPGYGDAIHLLAVFPPEADEAVIERLFAGQSVAGPTQRTGREAVRFDDLRVLRDRIHDEGNGLFILAHVENSKRGHRSRFIADRGHTLRYVVEGDDLKHDLSAEYAVYLANLEPDAVELRTVEDQRHYAPFDADGKSCRVACVAPADHHSLEDYERPDTATFLKVPSTDFRSIRDALRFHETRVRLPGQVTSHGAPCLVGLRLVSASGKGLFIDTTVAFSPNLTCLIGPRGSGKSTIIEALRYVLGRNSALTEQAERGAPSFANLAQGIQAANLQDTRIELLYQGVDGARMILDATFDEHEAIRTRVFTSAGDDLKISDAAIVADYPVTIFSWSEMEVLGRQASLQRQLVDRLLTGMDALIEERETLRAELVANREKIQAIVRSLGAARGADGGVLGRYRQYRESYETINTAEAAALFEDLDASRAKSELIQGLGHDLENLATEVEGVRDSAIGARADERAAAASARAQVWWEGQAKGQLRIGDLDGEIQTAAESALAAVGERKELLVDLQLGATREIERVELELRGATRLDKAQELMRDQRELARERFERADLARASYLALVDSLDAALAARRLLVERLATAQDRISAARERELTPLNERLVEVGGERLNITVERGHLDDREGVETFLNEYVLTQDRAGRYLQRKIAHRLCAMGRPTLLSVALLARDVAMLGDKLAVGVANALNADEANKLVDGCAWRQIDDDAEVDCIDDAVMPLLELAEQSVDDRVSIRLNGRAVDELSPGQRSSAMLPLIALAEKGPLIIDQPEDNLDNAMVGETLTRILADLKEQRQIIVSTHNPNIVVGGDAEQVVVLDAEDGHRAGVSITGSIDDTGVIESVLAIMEGGRDAFETRSRRYGVA